MRPFIANLRQTILQLAIEGKLVPQDPSDQPASKLLKQIEAAKQKLIEEGKIRKSKAFLPVDKDNEPFKISNNWAWVKLGSLGVWGSGATPLRSNKNYYGEGLPWFKSGEMNGKYLYEAEEHVTPLALQECSLRICKPGDLLVAMYGATAGKTSVLGIEAVTNQAIAACTPLPVVEINFLHISAKAAFKRLINQASGAAQPNISQVKITNTAIGLPPIAEQRRIVAKVDELMELCDELEEKSDTYLNILSKLRRTILKSATEGKLVKQDPCDESAKKLLHIIEVERQELVAGDKIRKQKLILPLTDAEKPFTVPNNWVWVRMRDVAATITDGTHKTPEYQKSGIPFVSIANLLPFDVLDFSRYVRYISKEEHNLLIKRTCPERGDVLFSRIGTLGLASKVRAKESFSIFVGLGLIKPIRTLINENYLEVIMNSLYSYQYQISTSTGSTRLTFPLHAARNMPLPLPPINEQKRIVAKVDELIQLCNQLEAKMTSVTS